MSAPTSARLDDLAARALALLVPGRRAVLGITGAPGAGKSTLADALAEALGGPGGLGPGGLGPGGVARLPMDGFHLADVELERLGRRDRKGAPDTFDAAGYAALLHRARHETEGTVYAPSFARDLEQPIAGAIPVGPGARLVITEGNYLLLGDGVWARVRPLLDAVWYVELDEDERLRRLVRRHEESGKSPADARAWARGSDQRNADLVAATRARADLVVAPL